MAVIILCNQGTLEIDTLVTLDFFYMNIINIGY